MASSKQIKQFCDKMGFTRKDLQEKWDRLLELEYENAIFFKKYVGNWTKLSISMIEEMMALDEDEVINMKHEKQLQQEKEQEELEKEKRQQEYYETHFVEIMIDKIEKRQLLTEQELERLVEDYTETEEEGDIGRWTQSMVSYCLLNGRYFAIPWERGLTELQPNEFDEQPYEVQKVETTQTMTVIVWTPIQR